MPFGCASDEQLERELEVTTNLQTWDEVRDCWSPCDDCNCAMKECQYCSHNGYHEDNEDGI